MSALSPAAPTFGRTALQSPPTAAPAEWDLSHVGFADVLSALNPLQYLPVVGTIYREVTGDKVHPALQVAVATAASVFLGPVGIAGTMLGVVGSELLDDQIAGFGERWAEASAAYHRAGRAA